MTKREAYLEQAQRESAAELARLMAETEATIAAEEAAAKAEKPAIEYLPDGGGDARRTRSGAWLLELE